MNFACFLMYQCMFISFFFGKNKTRMKFRRLVFVSRFFDSYFLSACHSLKYYYDLIIVPLISRPRRTEINFNRPANLNSFISCMTKKQIVFIFKKKFFFSYEEKKNNEEHINVYLILKKMKFHFDLIKDKN
jgi:hypothetical protein